MAGSDGGQLFLTPRSVTVYAGQQVRVRHVSVVDLLPPTDDFMTYEGSMTQPGCHETVTWIIVNKPIYVTSEQALNDTQNNNNSEHNTAVA